MNNTFLVHRHICCFIRKLNGEKTQAFSCSQDQISERSDRQAPEEQKKQADGWGLRTSHPAPISNPVRRSAPLTVPPSRTSNEPFSSPICASSWNLRDFQVMLFPSLCCKASKFNYNVFMAKLLLFLKVGWKS